MNIEQKLVSKLLDTFYSDNSSGKFFLLASPAWGKTTLIMNLFQTGLYKRIIFISPLRALNLEFQQKLKDHSIPTYDSIGDSFELKGICIATPEKIICKKWEAQFEAWADLIVFDEFHLLDMWQSFRPLLIECWYWLANVQKRVLVMSGTFDWGKWSNTPEGKLWLSNTEAFFKLDLHEKKLINEPFGKYYFPSYLSRLMAMVIKMALVVFPHKRLLIFFPRREQVVRWSRWCKKHRISYLNCLGGQTERFLAQLVINPDPQVLLCTSVLSHGVNLPKRDIVIIFGQNWPEELWIQMKSRGGRRGEKYYLVSEKQVWMN